MEQIYQSTILQALGWAIADSLWQMALLWLVYQVAIGLPVRNNPAIRHMGATVALFTGGLWFIGNVVYKLFLTPSGRINGAGTTNPTITGWLESLLPYLSTAYLVILVLLLARFIHSMVLTQRLRITENQSVMPWQEFVDGMALRFFISRKVLIQISDTVNVPATIGFARPVILLPIASVNNLTVAQVEAIIMHELAHIRRHDYLLNLIASLVETILFFNPFAYLLSNQMRKECELCCDDAVLGQKQDPGQYAYALLLLEKSRQQMPLVMAATGKESLLLGRVKRILKQPERQVKYRHKLIALGLVAGLVMILSLINPSAKKDDAAPLHMAQVSAVPEINGGNPSLPMMLKVTTDERIINRKTSRSGAPLASEPISMIDKPDAPPHPAAPANPSSPPNPIIPPHAITPPHPGTPAHPHTSTPTWPSPPEAFGFEFKAGDIIAPRVIATEEQALLALKGLEDKQAEIEEVFRQLGNGKVILDMDLRMQDILEQSAEMKRVMETEHRRAMAQRKMSVNMQKRDEQMRKMNREEMNIVFPRKAAAPKARAEVKEEIVPLEGEVFFKAIATPGPKVKTFKDENGTTISIIEENSQIRIMVSSR